MSSKGVNSYPAKWGEQQAEGTTANSAWQDDRGQHYTPAELAYLRAVEAWKMKSGRKFPSVVDFLRIAYSLGYRLTEEPQREEPASE